MVEHRIKANQKWINDNMQEATANQKAKATNDSVSKCHLHYSYYNKCMYSLDETNPRPNKM